MWLTPNCDSSPSAVSLRSELVTAALLMSTSMWSTRPATSAAASRVALWDERSRTTIFGCTCSAAMVAMTASTLDFVRDARIRVAGL